MCREKNKGNIRRLWSLALVMLLVMANLPAVSAVDASGDCGSSLQWSLQSGVLTITGTGDMADYSLDAPAPWYDYRGEITKLQLPEGLTSVGSYAFYECTKIEVLEMPDTVTRVGKFAFYECSGMQYLSMSRGLNSIERSAFERCWSLTVLDLPQGLQSIGNHAFWRCHALISVTVPQSVTEMGTAVFAYCGSLLQADIQAQISSLPEWTFYGCEKLSSVTLSDQVSGIKEHAFSKCDHLSTIRYQGEQSNADQILQDIQTKQENSSSANVVQSFGNSTSTSTFWDSEDKSYVQTDMVTQTEHAVVGTTLVYSDSVADSPDKEWNIQIDGTLDSREGWQDVIDQTEYILDLYGNRITDTQNTIEINVFIGDGVSVDGELLKELAGQPVQLTVQTSNGSRWIIDTSSLDPENVEGMYDLSNTLVPLDGEDGEWYCLQFNNIVQVNAEVMIQIPTIPAQRNAFLYQKNGSNKKLLQTVMVDNSGYAHFYLASVDNETEYLIGIDVADEVVENVIIPQNMYEEFDITDTLAPIDYEITGIKSSWGMDIGQVTRIMIVVLVGSVVIIGVVVYLLNKRKLKNGYIPNLDDEM